MEYNKEFKLKCIKLDGLSISETAKKKQIPKQTLSRWIKLHKLFGPDGLKNKKPGAKEKPINPIVEKNVLILWNKKKRSAYKMLKDLKIKNRQNHEINNYPISKRQIYKIYKKHNLK